MPSPISITCLCLVFVCQNDNGTMEEFFLVTKPESSGSAPTRAPPPVPATMPSPIVTSFSKSQSVHSQSFHSQEDQELTVDDIEDFEDEDEEEDEVASLRLSRRQSNNATDISLRLPPFTTGNYEKEYHICLSY